MLASVRHEQEKLCVFVTEIPAEEYTPDLPAMGPISRLLGENHGTSPFLQVISQQHSLGRFSTAIYAFQGNE
jgi:hypothetical protein